MISRFFYILVAFFLSIPSFVFAEAPIGFNGQYPEGTIAGSGFTIISVLSFIQSFLLKVVVPIIVVGTALYIAYQLFTADGDDARMKKAWKSITFSAIGLVAIGVSYAFVSLVTRLSL